MIIVNKNGTLIHKKKLYKCALGKKGITKNKREGDQKTPSGTFSLGKVFYRKDRTKNIKTKIKKYIIKKNKKKLFRKDNLYDIIIVINYNTRPIVKNKGSAIFIHLAKKNYSETMGCIGLKKNDLLEVLKTISKKTKIKIVA